MLKRSARMQKQLVAALDSDKGAVSRQCGGERTSEMSRYGEFVERLARYRHTDPSYALVYPQIVAARALADEQPLATLHHLLHRALTQETMQQCPADVAEAEYYRGNATLPELRERMVDHMAALQRCITVIDAIEAKGAK